MKITIKGNEKVEPKITIEDVEPGYVFEILNSGPFSGGCVQALKLKHDKVVLLNFSDGSDWFEIFDDKSWVDSPVKILGKVTEIVVDPNV